MGFAGFGAASSWARVGTVRQAATRIVGQWRLQPSPSATASSEPSFPRIFVVRFLVHCRSRFLGNPGGTLPRRPPTLTLELMPKNHDLLSRNTITMSTQRILVTAPTGYIGGRLVPQLLARGYQVRCLARDPNRLRGRGWEHEVEIVAGDVLDRASLGSALAGCRGAYYLVHSMAGGTGSFHDRDLHGAENFAAAGAEAGLERIIYLGGLGRREEQVSKHLSSRHEVGEILRAGTCRPPSCGPR